MNRQMLNTIITALITLAFILTGIFLFRDSYLRVYEATKDLFTSLTYFFSKLFNTSRIIQPTVLYPSKYLDMNIFLPVNTEEFISSLYEFSVTFIKPDNFNAWLNTVMRTTISVFKISVIAIPLCLIAFVIIKKIYLVHKERHNIDTLPLKCLKHIKDVIYYPLKSLVIGYIGYIREKRFVLILWLLIWLFNLNVITILTEFIAYYIFFSITYRFDTLYFQIYKLCADIQVVFSKLHWSIAVIPLIFLFERWRKDIALKRLHYYEARNCGFINELPIVSITCGSMGKKKTTMITDMALSQENMFRQKALSIIESTDMKFPFFPWILFEDELIQCMKHKTVYNLATVKEWIEKKRTRYERHQRADLQLYNYDIHKHSFYFNDALSVINIFDALETYALAYFVYVIESSLIVSNYSIREDNELLSEGNFPVWYNEFFPDTITEGIHSHILDFDTLRLGKKMIEDNPNIGSFEFGVIAITEIGKERGNNLELKEVKKSTAETNQKNDLFNSWLKMCRHSATIDNYPFVKVFTDEQRPESWGADARDLSEIVNITSSGEQRLALPFYTLEEAFSEFVFNRFLKLYYSLRYIRGDNTLLIYLLKSITSVIWKRNLKIHNRYGYSVLRISKELGTMDGKKHKKKYYLMNRKIYSKRFSTDCFSDYFNELAKRTRVGLNDYLEYASEKATVDELKLQNSYFINSLYNDNENHN